MCDGTCNNNSITEGLNGYNSYTYTTASFVMPALNNATPVTINLLNDRPSTGSWIPAGALIFIAGNYLRVVSSTANSVTVTNPANDTNYTSNDAPTTVIPTNQLVVIAGEQGPPITLPRRSVMIPTTLFTFPTPSSSGYQNFLTGNIPNYLTQEGDCLEICYSVFCSAGNAAGLKLILGGITVHELTNLGSSVNGYRYAYHKIKIIRGANNTSFSYFSEINYSTNVSSGVTDIRNIETRQLILASSTNSSTAVNNLSVVGQMDIGAGIGGTIGFFTAKFTPYDN